MSRADVFFRSIKDKKVAFLGIGVTNTDTIKLFLSKGVETSACDKRSRADLGDVAADLEQLGARLRLGPDYLDGLDADIVFRTPGFYFHAPALEALRRKGMVVTSEMEVFFDLCPCKTIAVTGSEGKTTTSTLIAEILKAQGKTVHLGGNIGKALLPLVFTIAQEDWAVVELSSFQLISMRPAPDISVITNITPDHLDVHASLDEYIDAKRHIYLHQNAFSRTVLNLDNPVTASFIPQVRGEAMTFSLTAPVEHGAYCMDGVLYRARRGRSERVMDAADIRIPGTHNAANYLAALCATDGIADTDQVRLVAGSFGGVEHRLEFVRELGGVRWYNDSIATAPVAVIAGLKAFDQKLILIAGGSDKNIPYEPLAPELVQRVKLLILAGPTADKIEAAVKVHPDYNGDNPVILRVDDIPGAVAAASQMAVPGDIV
ncbi:MAG: UDP-N-acetylmuramoyl-L-alanine--D-glutamate ligase, partial [Oscillospiraceae bacterium]|nr:UDP-N-acetylmuramoyl-L-alanine--D-glutamate ligase [Oscillospiraceae bacterium]